MTNQERLKRFIVENFYVADPAELGEETSLIDGGYVDSTGMLELIAFLETEFGVQVADTDATPANLGSIACIAAFLDRKGYARAS